RGTLLVRHGLGTESVGGAVAAADIHRAVLVARGGVRGRGAYGEPGAGGGRDRFVRAGGERRVLVAERRDAEMDAACGNVSAYRMGHGGPAPADQLWRFAGCGDLAHHSARGGDNGSGMDRRAAIPSRLTVATLVQIESADRQLLAEMAATMA